MTKHSTDPKTALISPSAAIPAESAQGATDSPTVHSELVVSEFRTLSTEQQQAVVQEINSIWALQNDKSKLQVWTMLFAILGGISAIAALGAVWAFLVDNNTAGTALLGVVTTIIAGLLGIFANSPAK